MSRSLGLDAPQYSLLDTCDADEDGSLSDSSSDSEDLDIDSLRDRAASGRQWNRHADLKHKVLTQFALKGQLVQVLEEFEMPLYSYRGLASIYFHKAQSRFNEEDKVDHETESDKQTSWLTKPTRQARLLSNYLLVPDMPLQKWMREAEIPMVVFDKMHDNGRAKGKQIIPHNKKPVPFGFQEFPDRMGAFYISLIVDWDFSKMKYHKDTCTLEVETPDGGRHYLEATRAFAVEAKSPKGMGMFPEKSKTFAWVYPHAELLEAGGFVYFEGEGETVCAFNQLSTVGRSHGFCMSKKQQKMNEQVSKLLEEEAKDVTLDFLINKGAKKFCFVGPGEPEMGQSFKDNHLGGFAYFFPDDEGKNCFFGIEFYCQVVERGPMNHLKAARLFPAKATSQEVKDGVVHSGWTCVSEEHVGQTVDMKVMRLRQRGLAHPVVLFGLVRTPNEKLLEEAHVQAIVSAAFKTYEHHLYFELATRILSLMSFSWFAFAHRRQTSGSMGFSAWQWCDWVCFGGICASWCSATMRLCLGLHGHSLAFGLGSNYFLGSLRLPAWWAQELIVLVAMCLLLRGDTQSRASAEASLSAAGAMCWVQLLFVLRGFVFFGKRLLPIISAWSKSGPFLLVNFFVLGACAQTSYSLTQLPMETIIFDTYRLGLLGEMRPRLFVRPSEDLDGSPAAMSNIPLYDRARSSWAYLALFLFGFVLMVSMTNIFIQVMGDAYKESKDRVEVILTHARAEESLISALWLGGADDILQRFGITCFSHHDTCRQYVWYTTIGECYKELKEEEDDEEQHKKASAKIAAAAASAAAAVAAVEDPRGARNERRVRLAMKAGLAAADAAANVKGHDTKEVADAAAKAAMQHAAELFRAGHGCPPAGVDVAPGVRLGSLNKRNSV